MIGLGLLVAIMADAPMRTCPAGRLCVDARRITALPDTCLRCLARGGPAFDLTIAGEAAAHARPATIVPTGLHLPAGRADNRYAPLGLNIGGLGRITENFAATDGSATYYLTISSRFDQALDSPAGEQDVHVVAVHYEITRGTPGVMAKRYADGDCIIMDGQS